MSILRKLRKLFREPNQFFKDSKIARKLNLLDLEFGERLYFLEKEGSSKLLVVLSTHNQKKNYFWFKSFKENLKSNVLFVNNPENNYYSNQVFSECLEEFKKVQSVYKGDITFFGSSMAGYAATRFACELDESVIASNPQFNFEVSTRGAWKDLLDTFDKIEGKVNLDNLIIEKLSKPAYFFFGSHKIDIENMELLYSLACKKKQYDLIIQKLDVPEHGFHLPSVDSLYAIQELLGSLKEQRNGFKTVFKV